MDRPNLKLILMQLGNKLVTERRFNPGAAAVGPEPSTMPITIFTRWLNETPDAQEVLDELGIDWPVA